MTVIHTGLLLCNEGQPTTYVVVPFFSFRFPIYFEKHMSTHGCASILIDTIGRYYFY